MKTNRPRIAVPFEPMDVVIDLISVSILVLMIIYTSVSYSELPEIIPSHFNGKGEVDGHSNKLFLWMLPALGLITFVGLFILNKYPHLHNYMVNITEENALKNYRFSTRILRFSNLFVMIILGVVTYAIIQSANGTLFKLGSWFMPTVIGISVLLPIFILVYKRNINKA